MGKADGNAVGFPSRKKRSFYKSPGAGVDKRYMTGQLKLEFWNENEVNVVFRGRHGVGEITDDRAQNQSVDKIVTLVDSRRPSRSKQAQSLV